MAMKQPNRKRKLSMDSREHLNQNGCLVRCQLFGPFLIACAYSENSHCCIVCITTIEVFFQLLEPGWFQLSFMCSGIEYKCHYCLVHLKSHDHFKGERRPFLLERWK